MNKYYLGIDTSAYTTSISLIDDNENIIFDLREYLKVHKNQKGLRQQEAVFQHLNNFPKLIEKLSQDFDFSKIHTISVSSKPRNIQDSYMPVFIFGRNQAYILSKILKANYKEFSHQEGHISAGLINNKNLFNKRFISLHISGGTCEFLLVDNLKENLNISLIGGSLDISFGQLIDRIGVYLGYEFPSGAELDKKAMEGELIDTKVPINIKDGFWTNISGLENYFKNLIDEKNHKVEDIIFTLFYTISRIIIKIILNTYIEYEIDDILITGGVAANSHIRKFLIDKLSRYKINVFFPYKKFCTDNAVGISYLGKIKKGHGMEV